MEKPIVLDDQIGFNLHQLSLLFRRELLRCLSQYSLTPEQWQALATLWQKDRLSQSEIAAVTQQDAPTVSRMLARMERDGWVQREVDSKDQRVSRVVLTEAGRNLADVLPDQVLSHFAQLLSPFPVEKQQQLLTLLRELRGVLASSESLEAPRPN